LGANRVCDHGHLTGKYRGAAHNEWNLNYSFSGRIPVILHNLRVYDSHCESRGYVSNSPETHWSWRSTIASSKRRVSAWLHG
jgi:hypothetical protein